MGKKSARVLPGAALSLGGSRQEGTYALALAGHYL
jgi:hypothetical protein